MQQVTARRAARFAALTLAVLLGTAPAAGSTAAPRQDRPVWTKPQRVAPAASEPGFPAAVAVGQSGRTFIAFGCTRTKGGTNRHVLCGRWRERNGTMRPPFILGSAPAAAEDGLVEAAVNRKGVATVVWETTRGLSMKRVGPKGRTGSGRLLTTDKPESVTVTGADSTLGDVAVTWTSREDDSVRLLVLDPAGVPSAPISLPGTTVRRVAPIPGGGGLGYAVLTSDAELGSNVARYDLTEISPEGTVRGTALVDEATTGADISVRYTGTVVLVWWRTDGDSRALTERRYPDGLAGKAKDRRVGPVRPDAGQVTLASGGDGNLYLLFSTSRGARIAVVPWSGHKPFPHVAIDTAGTPHTSRGELVFLHPVASTVGQYVRVQTWNGRKLSRARHVLVDKRFDNECGDSRFDVASNNGHIAVVNVRELGCRVRSQTIAQIVYRD